MKTNKIFLKDDKIISVSVPVYYFKIKGDDFVYAECPSLAITTDGATLEKAKKMFKEAFDIWMERINEKGNIRAVLKELDWKITKSSIIPKDIFHKTPIELLTSKMMDLQIILDKAS
ncbi:MAG: hypothetical protein LBT79_00210 [Elusimicrobiota bacterium]|jgi:predicted RNase H-like HicB family nuclease|nr:hypothetical protein [Elusimicrobiota bacterium]